MRLLIALLLFFQSSFIFSQNYEFINPGNWSDPANWVTYPGDSIFSNSLLLISLSADCTLDIPIYTDSLVIIDNAQTLTLKEGVLPSPLKINNGGKLMLNGQSLNRLENFNRVEGFGHIEKYKPWHCSLLHSVYGSGSDISIDTMEITQLQGSNSNIKLGFDALQTDEYSKIEIGFVDPVVLSQNNFEANIVIKPVQNYNFQQGDSLHIIQYGQTNINLPEDFDDCNWNILHQNQKSSLVAPGFVNQFPRDTCNANYTPIIASDYFEWNSGYDPYWVHDEMYDNNQCQYGGCDCGFKKDFWDVVQSPVDHLIIYTQNFELYDQCNGTLIASGGNFQNEYIFNIIPNQNYLVRVWADSQHNCISFHSTFLWYWYDTTLKLAKAKFTVQKQNDQNLLSWEYSIDNDIVHEIQKRRASNTEFETISSITGLELQDGKSNFKYVDQFPFRENYYRIKFIHKDKEISYSEVQFVENTITSGKLYPNPATDKIHLEGIPNNEKYQIFDFKGNIVKEGIFSQSAIEINNLRQGLFFLNFPSLDEQIKFIKGV